MHIPSPPGDPPPLVVITQESIMAMQNNSYIAANGEDDDIGVGNKLNFYPAVDEDYETRRAEQQAESLIPLKEDLAEWIQRLLDIPITTETFLQALDNGAALCRLAFLIQSKAEETCREGKCSETIPRLRFRYRENAKSRTWYARDNTANFLRWCRDFGINEGCMFESEDLVCHRQEKPVVVCLLELARLGYRFGIEPPSIVKIEKEIEREESELASQRNEDEDSNVVVEESVEIGDEEGEVEADDSGAETKKQGGEGDDQDEIDADGEEDGETDCKPVKEEEHIVEIEEKKLVDGMNGNGREEDSTGDAFSVESKSRATSQAASHQSGQNDNDEENAERDKEGEEKEEEGEEEDGGGEEGEEKDDEVKEDEEGIEDREKAEGEEGGLEEKEEVTEKEKEQGEGEGMNGAVNGSGGDENGNENEDENKESSSENKGGDSRPNSPAKNDSGTTSPSRKSPTNTRSRIDNIKARQLDKKVKHIASEHNVSEYVSQISEGKYCIMGRVVFIRLLKEKHLMVRVGGGWDTLDHYLSHHSPTKILEFKRNDQTKTPATSPRSDPDTGESAAGTNNTADEKFLVISGKYKRN